MRQAMSLNDAEEPVRCAVMEAQLRGQVAVSDPAMLPSGSYQVRPRATSAGAMIDLTFGHLMLTVLGGLAEFERDLIRARPGGR